MTFRDLQLRLRALVAPRRTEQEMDEELAFHLDCETRKYIAQGMSPDDARRTATARFGSLPLAADQCRDVRGTSFIDDCVRDVLYAFRTFRRAPLAAVTIVGTVALGLGLVAAVFTFFNAFFFRADAVRDPGELFAVKRRAVTTHEPVPFTRPEYDALRRDTRVFVDTLGMLRGVSTRVEGRVMNAALVTGNFFQLLGVDATLGRTLIPADDEGGGRPVIVLSHAGWSRWFARDAGIVGRTVRINGFPFEIAGVAPDGFRGLALGPPDYWAPLSLVAQLRSRAGLSDRIAIDVVGRLASGMTPERAAAGLSVWASAIGTNASGGPRPAIRLEPKQGTLAADAGEALVVFVPLFVAFGLILLIGCANVANLLLARGVSRQREIGVRLSLGASRLRIVRQLLTESLLLALAAAAGGLAISRTVLDVALYAAIANMPAEIAESFHLAAPAADWRVVLFVVSGAVLSTVLFGLAPALQATRLELIRTMRGEVARDARPGRARHALIALQVGASALLLICAAVFLRSALAASALDLGVRTADTLVVEIANEPLRAAIVQSVVGEPAVAAMAASSPHALSRPRSAMAEVAAAGSLTRGVSVGYRLVSSEYFGVLDISVVRGRGFTPAERSPEAGVAVVSETAARHLWPGRDGIGQTLRLDRMPSRLFTVVGIVRDVRGFRLADWPRGSIYLPTGFDAADTSLTLRVHGDPDRARAALVARLSAVDPAMGDVMTLRGMARLEMYFLRILFWVTVTLGTVALVLTLSGLFSVLSYLVEQRRKEIGVRLALGATAGTVAKLVVWQSVRPVGLGLITGSALAAALATALMSTSTGAEMGEVIHVYDPLAYAASISCIVTSCIVAALVPAMRAGRIDPIATLRQD